MAARNSRVPSDDLVAALPYDLRRYLALWARKLRAQQHWRRIRVTLTALFVLRFWTDGGTRRTWSSGEVRQAATERSFLPLFPWRPSWAVLRHRRSCRLRQLLSVSGKGLVIKLQRAAGPPVRFQPY